MTRTFIAELQQEPDGGFTVTFPEAPGSITCGATFEEALAMGREALDLILEVSAPPSSDGAALLRQARDISARGGLAVAIETEFATHA
jgi:predicted RNase H-like HicB family nuclease